MKISKFEDKEEIHLFAVLLRGRPQSDTLLETHRQQNHCFPMDWRGLAPLVNVTLGPDSQSYQARGRLDYFTTSILF